MVTAEIVSKAFVLDGSGRSSDSRRAMMGIHQIWVHKKARRQGIASRLVSTARTHFVFGTTVPVEMVAFSSPTQAGINFAQGYVDGVSVGANGDAGEVLVYDIRQGR